MKITKENIFEEAKKGNIEVLNHKDISIVKNEHGCTPLHFLSEKGKVEALNHKDISVVKDMDDETPLHWLAQEGKAEILKHKDVSVVKDNNGWTPLHDLARVGKVPRKYIKDTFPWFKIGKRKITHELITEILETNNSCKFIGSL